MPYWIQQTLVGTPAYAWIYLVLGVLWALVILPRGDWRRRIDVLALGFALGPAMLTVWMFVLGTVGGVNETSMLRLDLTLIGVGALTLIGVWLVVRKARISVEAPPRTPLVWDEKLLIGLITSALVVRWIVIAYWSFTAYDALWVYGYEARLYFLRGFIPQSVGYYPQFIPLQYTFGQLAVGGIDDHAARAVIIFIHLGSILAAYVLGSRLFNRRVGIILAAIWTLYPHTGEWSRAGDLEIPLAFLFTLAGAFFLIAWRGDDHRRRYAMIAGLVFGIGLWTKPTMGAFVWGVGLLATVRAAQLWISAGKMKFGERLKAAWLGFHSSLETLLIMGLASLPIGLLWYVRNIAYGHAAIDFPPSFWLEQALRSGGEFGWILAGLTVLLLWLMFSRRQRPNRVVTLMGVALITVGVLPTILEPRRMNLTEWAAFAAGLAILAFALWRYAKRYATPKAWRAIRTVGMAFLLTLPYFVTWFYSYSYHFRLSFAIVPLLILPSALVLSEWLKPERFVYVKRARLTVYAIALIIVAIPGSISAIYDLNGGWDYLWTDEYPTDEARYRSGNAALMNVVDGLNVWKAAHPGETLHVSAPGVDRLPFFFPLDDIRVDDPPTQLSEVEDVTYFVYGTPETQAAYQQIGGEHNQVVGALGRVDLSRRAWGIDDGTFRFDVFELNARQRFEPKSFGGVPPDDVVFGGFARYLGYDLIGLHLWPGRPFYITFYWQVLERTQSDYSIYIHLLDSEGNFVTNWDAPVARTPLGYYSTRFWEPGEIIKDERVIRLPEGMSPSGEGYQFWVGLYDPITNIRVPATINGVNIVDGYLVDNRIQMLSQQPS